MQNSLIRLSRLRGCHTWTHQIHRRNLKTHITDQEILENNSWELIISVSLPTHHVIMLLLFRTLVTSTLLSLIHDSRLCLKQALTESRHMWAATWLHCWYRPVFPVSTCSLAHQYPRLRNWIFYLKNISNLTKNISLYIGHGPEHEVRDLNDIENQCLGKFISAVTGIKG